MIIYSCMPLELIFENMGQTNYEFQEAEFEGVKMVVEPSGSFSEARIIRLLSSNPQDYLNPRYMPGQTIHFRPNQSQA
jgi:hypothetical protein